MPRGLRVSRTYMALRGSGQAWVGTGMHNRPGFLPVFLLAPYGVGDIKDPLGCEGTQFPAAFLLSGCCGAHGRFIRGVRIGDRQGKVFQPVFRREGSSSGAKKGSWEGRSPDGRRSSTLIDGKMAGRTQNMESTLPFPVQKVIGRGSWAELLARKGNPGTGRRAYGFAARRRSEGAGGGAGASPSLRPHPAVDGLL